MRTHVVACDVRLLMNASKKMNHLLTRFDVLLIPTYVNTYLELCKYMIRYMKLCALCTSNVHIRLNKQIIQDSYLSTAQKTIPKANEFDVVQLRGIFHRTIRTTMSS